MKSKRISWSVRKGALRLAVVVLVMVGLIVVQAPADATIPSVWGKSVCDSTTGKVTITWSVSGDTNHSSETATIKSQSIATVPTLVGQTVRGSGTVSGVQSDVRPGVYTMTVQVQWSNHHPGDLVTATSQPVKVKDDCTPPPPVAQCPDGTSPGDLNGDGVADAKDCGYTPPVSPPPPSYVCPPGTTWVDYDGDKVQEPGECPAPPEISLVGTGCSAIGQAQGKASFRLTNPNLARVTYALTLAGATQQVALEPHASVVVRFTGLEPGNYTVAVTGNNGLAVSTSVTIDRCEVGPPALWNPKAKVRAYCVTKHWGEGVAKLLNKRTTEPVRYHIVRSGKDRFVKVRAGHNRTVELHHLKVGSTVKVKAGGELLARTRVKDRCGTPPDTPTGARLAAGG